MNIGFIGFGNMADALAAGLIYKGVVSPDGIYGCAKNWDKLSARMGARGYHACRTAKDVIEACDIIILALKPAIVQSVLTPVREELKNKTIISVVAGYTFEKYKQLLGEGYHHITTTPNMPVSVGEGIIIYETIHSLSANEFILVKELLSPIALFQEVETSQLGIGATLCGCGPAFVALFLDALADAAVQHGLPRELSIRLASQMVAGTSQLQLLTTTHPALLKDLVCVPGGTTITGVAMLERRGFRSTIIDGLDAIEQKKALKHK